MYTSFFNLKKDPFNVAADPSFLFLSASHREALAGLQYGLLARKGFILMTGDAGTGKSTLIARIRAYLSSDRLLLSVVTNPTVTPTEFLELTLMDFGVRDIPASKAQRLRVLHELLLRTHESGKIVALIVDEAQKLSREVLEEIRLLGNFDHGRHKLLQIVLVGQNELNDVLHREDLRQLRQRVAVRLTIEPLSDAVVEDYIRYRWSRAGGQTHPFMPEAVSSVAHHSRGIPRLINTICDNALLLAFADSSYSVTATHIYDACSNLDLLKNAPVAKDALKLPPDPTGVTSPAAGSAAQANIPVAVPVLQDLERYQEKLPSRSLIARWFGKLGFVS